MTRPIGASFYIEPAYHLIQFRDGLIDFLAFDTLKFFTDLQGRDIS